MNYCYDLYKLYVDMTSESSRYDLLNEKPQSYKVKLGKIQDHKATCASCIEWIKNKTQ